MIDVPIDPNLAKRGNKLLWVFAEKGTFYKKHKKFYFNLGP
jgi:hypothetical protein